MPTTAHRPFSRRAWVYSTLAWFLFAFLQSPGLTSADTKLNLTANPWGFLRQALYPWTDTFPLGQLQNQAYGYLFPHGLFFAVFSFLPDWVTQRLWWGLLLALAFAGTVLLLQRLSIGSRGSRVIAGILFALSPRILTTLGAISSEAWVCALVPWVLLPVASAAMLGRDAQLDRRTRSYLAKYALLSALAVLCLGAVNAVATAVAILPAVIFWLGMCIRRPRVGLYFALWWVPAGLLATFWWIGPLLLLGKYSPPFTDYIESASLTTNWMNLAEILRGTTSWTPFLSAERQGGYELVGEPVFVAGTLLVAFLGLWGLTRPQLPFARCWLTILLLGVAAMVFATAPISPLASWGRVFLDGAGAPLRNLHKFDPLVRLALVVGLAHGLAHLPWPGLSRERWARWLHPEKNAEVPRAIAICLLVAVVTATGWSGRIAAADAYRSVPDYWTEAADWLNSEVAKEAGETHAPARTMILPKARFARQTWGNTRDEPAQPLLDVPWVVRDSVPLVQPEAIRGLDGVQRELEAGTAIPSLAAALWQQGVGYLALRFDLTTAADTPGAKRIERTLERSGGFSKAAAFGDDEQVQIYRVDPVAPDAGGTGSTVGTVGTAGDLQIIDAERLDVTHSSAESLPRLAAADAALGRQGAARTRVGASQGKELELPAQTVTDTPALRDHNYGNVVGADSEIRSEDDPVQVLNPVRDYPVRDADGQELAPDQMTRVEGRGEVRVSSTAADPTSFGGAETYSSATSAVDGSHRTAWRPTVGNVAGQYIEFRLDEAYNKLGLHLDIQGRPARVQLTTYLQGKTVSGTSATLKTGETNKVKVPAGRADAIRVTIVGSFGDFGISEAKVLADGEKDVTPQRVPTVPPVDGSDDPQGNAGATLNRWVFGQEINESVMLRAFEVPEAIGNGAGELPVVVHTSEYAGDDQVPVTIDGKDYTCGDTLNLPAGKHVLSTTARWAALSVAEPLFGAAVRDTPAAQPLEQARPREQLAPGEQSARLEPSDKKRVLFSPSQANPGRIATLEEDGGTTQLTPITVNGWQQGWIVPEGKSGLVTIHFEGTKLYRAWLAIGLLAALVLVGLCIFVVRRTRRMPALPEAMAANTTQATERTPRSRRFRRVILVGKAITGAAAFLALLLCIRGAWGSGNYYAGGFVVNGALAVVLLAVVVSVLASRTERHQELIARRAGSSTNE
ncbi:Alpha-(1-_3)-arabinofuranosyltransferase [Corynebacterium jeikeium]|nr:Alpha-(1->3)-arabinofuranosyltransferase [Corynebacterium jeikeium]